MKSRNISNPTPPFVANTAAFNAIKAEIEGNIGSKIPQPVLIIGQEGSGKTTLLQWLIKAYPSLQFVWIDGRCIFNSDDIIQKVNEVPLFIIDNLDYYLDRSSYEDQFRLRRYLYNEGAPMMIASVSKLVPALTEYKAPFFEGLKKVHLPPITEADLTIMFGNQTIHRALSLFNLLPPTIQSARIIANILEINSDPNSDLEHLLSYSAYRYKQIYDSVSTNTQRILNILGNANKDMTVSEIRDAGGFSSGMLSPYLNNLNNRGIISIDNSITRRTKYSIKDPLFHIWLKKTNAQTP